MSLVILGVTFAVAMQGLRLHDNPALLIACDGAKHLYPIFILDPWFLTADRYAQQASTPACQLHLMMNVHQAMAPSHNSQSCERLPCICRVGPNRIQFLLESLEDLKHR